MLNPIVKASGGVSPYDIRKFDPPATTTTAATTTMSSSSTTSSSSDGDGVGDDDDHRGGTRGIRRPDARPLRAADGMGSLQAYLDDDAVRAALHLPTVADSARWGQGAGSTVVESALIPDLNAPTSLPLWPSLLARGVRVLVYNGNMDLICNHIGTDAYLRRSLQWGGRDAFLAAPRTPFMVPVAAAEDGAAAEEGATVGEFATTVGGWARSSGNLTQLVVANAGHMAPGDAPLACLEMMQRFLRDAPFDAPPSFHASSDASSHASPSASSSRVRFAAFVERFNKTYGNADEFAHRFATFKANLALITAANAANAATNTATIVLGVGPFADMTKQEYAASYATGFAPSPRRPTKESKGHAFTDFAAAEVTAMPPASIDWRTRGAVNAIRNQYQCGACWAFSANAAAEAAWALANHTLPIMSEQQLVDCSSAEGNAGCAHGSMDFAFEYMQKTGKDKLCDGRNYKYVATTGFCFASECKNTTGVEVTGYHYTPKGNESALLAAVGTVGVVSVGIQANQTGFQHYKSGVFNGTCGTRLDHAVAIVGYGSTDSSDPNGMIDYWIIRNSWGTGWGEDGYMRLARGGNLCGVADSALYPTVAH
jgi:hypothetical protein